MQLSVHYSAYIKGVEWHHNYKMIGQWVGFFFLFSPNSSSVAEELPWKWKRLERKKRGGIKNSLLSSQGCQIERIRHKKLKTTGSSQKLKPKQTCTARCITLIFAMRCSHSSLWYLSFVPHTSIDPSCRLKTHKPSTHAVHPWNVQKHFLMNIQRKENLCMRLVFGKTVLLLEGVLRWWNMEAMLGRAAAVFSKLKKKALEWRMSPGFRTRLALLYHGV